MKDKHGSRWTASWRAFAPLVAILALVLIFGLPGCSDKPLDVNTSQEDISFFDLPFDDDALAKRGLGDYEAVYRTEDYLTVEDGGSIAINGHDGAYTFVVEPYSFPEDTRFTVAIYVIEDTPTKTTIVYEFGPDGLEFTVPAHLILNADAVAAMGAESIDFYYLNGNKWAYQGTYFRNKDNQFVIPIEHFSKYGTA
jgi:hypothetical protein